MPLPTSVVGRRTEPIVREVDARWTMAYAAGIDDLDPAYLDTTRALGLVAHPLFPVCVEWPAVTAARRLVPIDELPSSEAARGVHASHDLVVHRAIRPGDLLTTTATAESVESRSPGAYQVLRLDTVDATGAPVCTTRMGSLFLGVAVTGPPAAPAVDVPTPPLPTVERPTVARHEVTRSVAGGAAHVYTECSRIWNPIHTDLAVAEGAGLPGLILHGTATLAMAVTELARLEADGGTRLRRVACRFGAMVAMPSTITVRQLTQVEQDDGSVVVAFDVLTQDGTAAVRDGTLVFLPA